MNLKNKKVLITGATGGIGKSLVDKFYNFGATVVATGTNEEKLNNLKKQYDNIIIEKFKLDEHSNIEGFIDKVDKQLEGIDVLVNNAGITLDNLSIRLTEENWKTVLDINLKSSFLMSKKLLRKMISEKWGRIIHISSIVGNNGTNGTIAYSTSKTGLVGMSRVLSKEYGRFGITSNILIPGYLNTGLISSLSKEAKSKILKKIPSNKFGDPVNIVNAVEFLIKSDYVNGASINIDGGY